MENSFLSRYKRVVAYDKCVNPHQSPLDLDAIEQDLEGVDIALARLDQDTYWTDEITGQPLSKDLLATKPTARRNL